MTRRTSFPQEVRERYRWWSITRAITARAREAICSIAEKIGCSPETLRKWRFRAEVDFLVKEKSRRIGVVVERVMAAWRKPEQT